MHVESIARVGLLIGDLQCCFSGFCFVKEVKAMVFPSVFQGGPS